MAHERRAGGLSGEQGGFGFELELHEALVICPFWLFCLHMSHEQFYPYHSLYVQKSINTFMLWSETQMHIPCMVTLYQFSTWQNIESPWKPISEHVCEVFYRLRSLNSKCWWHHSMGWGLACRRKTLCINIHGSVSQLWMQCDQPHAPATDILA